MTVSFYVTNEPNNKVDKALVFTATFPGTLREECDLVSPVIRCSDVDNTSLVNVNYVHIPEFERYYYITDVTLVNQNLYDFKLHVDVLMSYKNEIRDLTAVIARQQNDYNLYLDDGLFKIYQNPLIQTKAFSGGFNGESYVLAISG